MGHKTQDTGHKLQAACFRHYAFRITSYASRFTHHVSRPMALDAGLKTPPRAGIARRPEVVGESNRNRTAPALSAARRGDSPELDQQAQLIRPSPVLGVFAAVEPGDIDR